MPVTRGGSSGSDEPPTRISFQFFFLILSWRIRHGQPKGREGLYVGH